MSAEDKVQAALMAVADARQELHAERAALTKRIVEIDAALAVFSALTKKPNTTVSGYTPRPGSCGDRVVAYLRVNGCNRPAAIAKAIGAPYSRTSSTIDYLVRRGVVEVHPGSRGIYQVVRP